MVVLQQQGWRDGMSVAACACLWLHMVSTDVMDVPDAAL